MRLILYMGIVSMIFLGASCKKILESGTPMEREPFRFPFETTELYTGSGEWISEDSVKTWQFKKLNQGEASEYKGYTSHWPGNFNTGNFPTTEFWYDEYLKDSIRLNLDFFQETITLYRHYEDGVLQIGDTKYYKK